MGKKYIQEMINNDMNPPLKHTTNQLYQKKRGISTSWPILKPLVETLLTPQVFLIHEPFQDQYR